tara:strand:- start:2315 stop:2599 length:285 start_codon:yes stop_codon:yes gene_type:complete
MVAWQGFDLNSDAAIRDDAEYQQEGLTADLRCRCTPEENWVVALSVCFLRTCPFSLQVQRMSANRPSYRIYHACHFRPEAAIPDRFTMPQRGVP